MSKEVVKMSWKEFLTTRNISQFIRALLNSVKS